MYKEVLDHIFKAIRYFNLPLFLVDSETWLHPIRMESLEPLLRDMWTEIVQAKNEIHHEPPSRGRRTLRWKSTKEELWSHAVPSLLNSEHFIRNGDGSSINKLYEVTSVIFATQEHAFLWLSIFETILFNVV